MWTLKQFEEVFDRYQSSGLRVKDFCRNECILESKFYYWQRKSRERDSRKEQSPGFVPIVFPGSNPLPPAKGLSRPALEHVAPGNDNVLEIVYPNGVKVRVPAGIDLSRLRSLILLNR